MNIVEGFDKGNVAVRKLYRNIGKDARYEVHLGGSLEFGNALVVLTFETIEAANAFYDGCHDIAGLEVNS